MVKVKICGITRPVDAHTAMDAGADAIGFIFVPGSPRYVQPEHARRIIADLPPFVTPVGVFVDATRTMINEFVGISGVRCLQLHGNEPPEDLRGYSLPVYKAFSVSQGFDIRQISAYGRPVCLLDTYAEGRAGGTGRTFDWNIAREAKAVARVILSGGLHPGNVGEAIRTVEPYAIDVSSGVESAPGIKDPDRIMRLMAAVRAARTDGA